MAAGGGVVEKREVQRGGRRRLWLQACLILIRLGSAIETRQEPF